MHVCSDSKMNIIVSFQDRGKNKLKESHQNYRYFASNTPQRGFSLETNLTISQGGLKP